MADYNENAACQEHLRPKDYADDTDSDDEPSFQEKFKNMLSSHAIKSAFEKTPFKFVPEGIIHELITEDQIKAALNTQAATVEEAELVEFIRMRAKKIFAIAIYVQPNKILPIIKWWKKKDMDDRDLPITSQPAWKKPWLSEFCDGQWMFLAPVFSTTQYNHNLDEAHILPFVYKRSDSGRGSFGVVSQYVIQRKHLDPVSMRFPF